MANEANIKSLILLIALGVLVRSCMSWGGGDVTELQASTDRTMGEAKSQHEAIGREISASSRQLDDVGEKLGKLEDGITRMQIALDRHANQIRECKHLVEECRRINQENKSIIDQP